MTIVGSFRAWLVALCAVAALTLLAAPAGSSVASRVARLEALVRCPSCEDLSVAQSNATSAIAVRHEIAAKVRRGVSDTAILTSLEAAYGPSILLSPPTSGLGSLLWAVPAGAAGLAGVVVTRLVRRR